MYGPGLLLGLVTVSELDIQSDPCVHGLREEREREAVLLLLLQINVIDFWIFLALVLIICIASS